MIHWVAANTGLFSAVSKTCCRRNFSSSNARMKYIYKYPKILTNRIPIYKESSVDDELFNSLTGKVVYNCAVAKRNNIVRWHLRNIMLREKEANRTAEFVPLSLKYKYGDSIYEFEEYRNTYAPDTETGSGSIEEEETENNDELNLPYSITKKVDFQSDTESSDTIQEDEHTVEKLKKRKFAQDVDPPRIIGKKWMSDYDVYEEEQEGHTESIGVPQAFYGSADPHVLPSKVPCGGCGAHLHCQNSSIPGYLPKELFLNCEEKDFHFVVCQRCTFLKNYNVALSLSVDHGDYPKLLSSIKNKRALVLMMVDMTDFPCSIWPGILDVIGRHTPIILVGNKLDLIPGDYKGWLGNAERVLRISFPSQANIIATSLISAKTGFGVEELITILQSKWEAKGDVYLVGCTNVGKSSLFNALIKSDFCKSKAVDLIQRATVSQWPGTTLNLLKFPILRPSAWRSFIRVQRLKSTRTEMNYELQLEKLQAEENHTKFSSLPRIVGEIGMTFQKPKDREEMENQIHEEFIMPQLSKKELQSDDRKFLDPNDPNFKYSRWCYDTPGVVHDDQMINLLTTEELNLMLPTKVMRARMFSVYPKHSLFLAGLARVDVLESEEDKFVRVLVYASNNLPITICKTECADEVYNTLLGTRYMKVPCGSLSRLEKWPPLKSTQDFELMGEGHATNTSEIVLSSAGWISFTYKFNQKFKVRPWVPEGRGIHLRKNPLLRFTPRQRRRRIAFTPTYYMVDP